MFYLRYLCFCLRIVVSNIYCAVFLFVFLCLVYPILPVSLDCPFFHFPEFTSPLMGIYIGWIWKLFFGENLVTYE
jgi:hypothetical protein